MSTLVERLRAIAGCIHIAADKEVADEVARAATEAADALTPPAEIVRYNLVRGEYFDDMEAYPTGEWVRYEDHTAALAAARAVPAEVVLETTDEERGEFDNHPGDFDHVDFARTLIRDVNTLSTALAASEAARREAEEALDEAAEDMRRIASNIDHGISLKLVRLDLNAAAGRARAALDQSKTGGA